MYYPSSCFEEEQDQEIVSLLTGEKYVYLEGDNNSILKPEIAVQGIDMLPVRFFKTPFITRAPNGQVRVFGRID
jgi:hypothetical protein